MKKILVSSTAITAVFASLFLLTANRAQAATAKETFRTMRAALAKAARDGELTVSAAFDSKGATNISILLNGQPLPPDVPVHVLRDEQEQYVDYTIQIDLSDDNFSSITYGADHDTLKLVPKAMPDNLDVIKLDHKSAKPADWSIYKLASGVWKKTSNVYFTTPDHPTGGLPTNALSKVTHDEPTSGPVSPDGMITVRMRMSKAGGSATMTIKKD